MSLAYATIDIQITDDSQILASSAAGGEHGPERLRLDRNTIELTLQLIEQGAATPEIVRSLGLQLYQALFPDEMLAFLARCRAEATDQRIRLRLRIADPQLSALPWELMHDGQQFLGLNLDTTIVRYPSAQYAREPLAIDGQLRILVAIASPANYLALDGAAYVAAFKQIFSQLQAAGAAEVEFLTNATYAGIIRRLRTHEYHILHLVGYTVFDSDAQQAAILLEEENGLARRMPGSDLAAMFYREDLGRVTRGKRALRLVLVSDCQRQRSTYAMQLAGDLVESGVPAAIAMQHDLPAAIVEHFAAEFYGAIGRGLPIDAAIAVGRVALEHLEEPLVGESSVAGAAQAAALSSAGAWGSLVLFMRSDDGEIFRPRQAEQISLNRSIEQVFARIEAFKVVTSDPITRFFINHLRGFTIASIVALVIHGLSIRRFDALLISAVLVTLWCVQQLRAVVYDHVPDTLRTLWRRQVIQPRAGGDSTQAYLAFLEGYNALLNNRRYALGPQILCVGVAVVNLLFLNYGSIPGNMRPVLIVVVGLLSPLGGYVVGTLLWKMIATVIATRELSYRFIFDVRPAHPDRCGGLKPLGDLYFAHARVLLVAGMFFAIWVLILSISHAMLLGAIASVAPEQLERIDAYVGACSGELPSADVRADICAAIAQEASGLGLPEGARPPQDAVVRGMFMTLVEQPAPPRFVLAYLMHRYHRWLPAYQILLLIVGLIAAFTFVYPMYNTHRTMRGQGPRFQRMADSLAGEIAELERYIEQYGGSDDREGGRISSRLAWLGERYQQYNDPPQWPFDARIQARLAGTLGTMLISLLLSEALPIIVPWVRAVFG
jgi:CHAT domain